MNVQQSPTLTVTRPSARNEAEMRLQGTWLVTARIAWAMISVLTVSLFVTSLSSYFTYLHIPATSSYAAPQLTPGDIHALQQVGLSLDFYAWLNTSVSVIILLVYVLVGVVLFWRKSDDRLALLASLSLVLFPVAFSVQVVGTLPAMWTLPAAIVEMFGNICLGLFFFVFPSGRFVPRWASVLMVEWIAYWAISDLFPQSSLANSWFFVFPLPLTVLCLIAFQVYRYRRVSTSVQRQQTKWVIAGFAFAFGPLVIAQTLEFTLLVQLFPTSSLAISLLQMAFDLLLLLFPLSLGFAILRYRLWDIDTLINKALVYGALSSLLAGLFVGLVFGLDSLIGLFTRQSSQPVVTVISTLAIAALFQPLRWRLQNVIDRRFYRRKYNAEQVLGIFRATLRTDVNLEDVSTQLLKVVQQTMEPEHVSLWLRRPVQAIQSPEESR